MTALQRILSQFREMTLTERDKGTSFENLMVQYFVSANKSAPVADVRVSPH